MREPDDALTSLPRSTRLYPVRQVARPLQIHEASVRKLVHSRELKAVRVGYVYRVPEPALEAYLEENVLRAPDGRWNGRGNGTARDARHS